MNTATAFKYFRPWLMVGLSIAAAYYGQPLLNSGTETAIGMLAAAFALLAGVLATSITVLGDPGLLDPARGWKGAVKDRPKLQAEIDRQLVYFYLYVFSLLLIVAGVLVPADYKKWTHWPMLFLGTLAVLGCLGLPLTLRQIQHRRLQLAIDRLMLDEDVPKARVLQYREEKGKPATKPEEEKASGQ